MKINKNIQAIFDKVINAMENDKSNWTKSWTGKDNAGLPSNINSRNHYNGINIWILMMRQADDSMSSKIWGTYKQWETKGYQVKEGEKGEHIVFWKFFDAKDDKGNETGKQIPFLKTSVVFNESQLEGYEPPIETEKEVSEFAIQWKVEEYVQNTNASVKYSETGGAFYHPRLDYINMPNKTRFFDTKDSDAEGNYYATLLHELVHWTGAEDRCNRSGISTKGKDKDIDDTFRGSYAFEELVAELGATILSVQLGVEVEPVANHSAYLNNWLKALKNDPSAMMTAFSKSTKAIMYLDDMQSKKKAVA